LEPKEETAREALVRAALHLIVTKGYHETTTDQIARTAGVGTGTLYLNFDSKEKLALEVLRRCAESVATGMLEAVAKANSTAERVRATIAHMFDWCERHPEEAVYLLLLRRSDMFTTPTRVIDTELLPLSPLHVMEQFILEGQRSGEIKHKDLRVLRKVGGIPLAFIRERLEGWHRGDLRNDVDIATKMCCAALGLQEGSSDCLQGSIGMADDEVVPKQR
jgi:AcrR family transcriptional regulator